MAVADSAVTTQLAVYAPTAKYSDLPQAVRPETVRSVFTILGRTRGPRHQEVNIANRSLSLFTGQPRATLVGRGPKTDAMHAALINRLTYCIYSFDDIHAQAVVHPSGPAAAAWHWPN
jgi:2-methylcitrate dehydratase PrpD